MKFYVYYLIDPRDESVFYIGKGAGTRYRAHEAEAKSGSRHPKCTRIKEIWDTGHAVSHRIIERFANETAAYDFERDEIERVGLTNLCNLVPGGGYALSATDDVGPTPSDASVVKLFRGVLRFTNDLTRPLWIYYFGKTVEIPLSLLTKLDLWIHNITERRGQAWIEKRLGKSIVWHCKTSGATT